MTTWGERSTLWVEVSSASPDSDSPVWVDTSSYLRTVGDAQPLSVTRGRQGELALADPSTLNLTLDNGGQPAFDAIVDDFDADEVVGGWGSTVTGQSWTDSGPASDFAVTGGVGVISPSATSVDRLVTLSVGAVDDRSACVDIAFNALPASGVLFAGPVCRYTDGSNYAEMVMQIAPAGTVTLALKQRVAGVGSTPASVVLSGSYVAGSVWRLLVLVLGEVWRARLWRLDAGDPSSWQLEHTLTTNTTGTGAGVIGRNESAVTTHVIRYDNFSVRDPYGPDRFTPDNPHSAYFWWRQSRRVRVREKIGPWVHDLFDGYLQLPEVVIRTDSGIDQSVSVSAVDRLARLEHERPFVSNLAEQIMAGPSAASLAYYWPLNDTAARFRPLRGGSTAVLVPTFRGFGASPTAGGPPASMVLPADQDGPPGDDVSYARISSVLGTSGVVWHPDIRAPVSISVNNATLAMALWCRPDVTDNTLEPASLFANLHLAAAGVAQFAEIRNDHVNDTGSGFVQYDYPTGSSGQASAGRALGLDVWRLATLRVTLPSGLVEFWVGADVAASATMSGTPPTTLTFDEILLGDLLFGSLAHVQIYVGAGVFPYSEHLAQFRAGLHGLDRQRTGQRVETVLDYAGVGARRAVDRGAAVMSQASLAGKTPRQALDEAVVTERGLLFTDGRDNVIFHDRHRRYNL